MTPRPAQYLLRFDDLCPTHDRERWQRFADLVDEFGIRPILAVVPDNHDPALAVSPPNPKFWDQMRHLQAAGATIGLHGYRHVCTSSGKSLVPLHHESEFAGADEPTQREWIAAGMRILREHGLEPTIWVAPRHGFDRITLRALRAEGISVVSDGFARRPFQRLGVTWIPQQLWAPAPKSSGLWTICLHANTATDAELAQLRDFLSRNRSAFTSVEQVLAESTPRSLSQPEKVAADMAVRRIAARRSLKRLLKRL